MKSGLLRIFFAIVAVACGSISSYGEKPLFSGSSHKVIEIVPDKSTGLDAVYVVYSIEGVSISVKASAPSSFLWQQYSNLGGGYAEPAKGVTQSGDTFTLRNPEGDMGYLINDGGNTYYFWLVDYSKHFLEINSLSIVTNEYCDAAPLRLEGAGEPIRYTSINGRMVNLNQEIKISYNTLEWDEASTNFVEKPLTYVLDSFHPEINITPVPLCNTYFTLTGDKFLEEWGMGIECESDEFITNAVDARTSAEQLNKSSDETPSNQISTDGADLGGSAPADISFYSYTTDAVIHHEWQISSYEDFDTIDLRFNQQDLDYTFREEGVFYVRYVGSNADGSCEVYGDTYTVSIGASELKCPNAFSPGTSEGVNDEWKVSYRSLIEFECWIFDRYGTQLCHFSDPSLGWDGRYRGKLVSPGTYFYVIDAKGADGKKYKLSGDINIVRFRGKSGTSSGSETAE